MRAFWLSLSFLFASVGIAQSSLKLGQLAEFAAGLAQPHDAAFAPERTLIYLTDIANRRMAVLEALTLQPPAAYTPSTRAITACRCSMPTRSTAPASAACSNSTSRSPSTS